ncbi:MAG TPA: integrase [Gammaproteobacteria bacterium]|nr:integrase [Gammaproteobacteria bacterium]
MLNDATLKALKPADKPYKRHDEKGLFLIVRPNGSKLWRFRYQLDGKTKELAAGRPYPETSLKTARGIRDAFREQLRNGIDPGAARKVEQVNLAAQETVALETFERIAREWHERQAGTWNADHSRRILRLLEKDLFPWLGLRPLKAIQAPELLAVLRRIEARGVIETAHRALQHCSKVFRYGIATGRAERDPAADLRGALTPVKTTHFPAITRPGAIGELLRALDGYQGQFVTRCALQLAPLVFVRPGELRQAEWSEFDLNTAEWRIPAARMKMRDEHIVPLSGQAVAILQELDALTGRNRYLFPGLRTAQRPMSENTVNAALRRLGYGKDEMCGHGFRSMASTLLHEQGFPTDVIERQLAHSESNKVKAAYNRAGHLPERRRMMQHWSDYLDGLKQGGEIVPIRRKLSTSCG